MFCIVPLFVFDKLRNRLWEANRKCLNSDFPTSLSVLGNTLVYFVLALGKIVAPLNLVGALPFISARPALPF